MSTLRSVAQVFHAREVSEGLDGRIWRSIGLPGLRNFSPFLMLDHSKSTTPGSFPDQPHRGQETITHLIQGEIRHEDFAGNKGTIRSGDLMSMTASRGIMHAKVLAPTSGESMEGLQFWVDLPAKLKYCEPRCRGLRASEIPVLEIEEGRVRVKVISGESHGVESIKQLACTPTQLLDMRSSPEEKSLSPC